MIKSKVNSKAELENDYPKLMANAKGLIVLFTESGVGTVVSPNKAYKCGEWWDDWIMGGFTGFKGEVTLSNGGK